MIPSPAFELALFLIRMTVKHCTWDAFVTLQGSLSRSERRELDDLLGHVDLDDVWALTDEHFPFISRELWARCLRSAKPGSSRWFQIVTASRLQRTLGGWSRRPPRVDTSVRMWRRVRTLFRRKIIRRGPVTNRLASGGALIAIVGGDGAGKSTVVDALSRWLSSEHIDSHTMHMGKPRWSPLTAIVKGLLKLVAATKRSSTSSAKALRSSLAVADEGKMTLRNRARLGWEVLTARDRFRTYRRARRLASNGSIVLCDRYPLPQVSLMDGAVTARMKRPRPLGPMGAIACHPRTALLRTDREPRHPDRAKARPRYGCRAQAWRRARVVRPSPFRGDLAHGLARHAGDRDRRVLAQGSGALGDQVRDLVEALGASMAAERM